MVVSHTKQTVKSTLKQLPWFSGASGCLVDCKINLLFEHKCIANFI